MLVDLCAVQIGKFEQYHAISLLKAISTPTRPFYDLGTRFKGGQKLPFYSMNYRFIADSKQLLKSFQFHR